MHVLSFMQKSAPPYENLKADEIEFSEPKSKKLREDSDYSESEQGESDHSVSQELDSQILTPGSDEGDHTCIYVSVHLYCHNTCILSVGSCTNGEEGYQLPT